MPGQRHLSPQGPLLPTSGEEGLVEEDGAEVKCWDVYFMTLKTQVNCHSLGSCFNQNPVTFTNKEYREKVQL